VCTMLRERSVQPCEYEIRQPGRLVTHSRAGRTASLIARRPDREKE
jgi:hypothetical protein